MRENIQGIRIPRPRASPQGAQFRLSARYLEVVGAVWGLRFCLIYGGLKLWQMFCGVYPAGGPILEPILDPKSGLGAEVEDVFMGTRKGPQF